MGKWKEKELPCDAKPLIFKRIEAEMNLRGRGNCDEKEKRGIRGR